VETHPHENVESESSENDVLETNLSLHDSWDQMSQNDAWEITMRSGLCPYEAGVVGLMRTTSSWWVEM